MSDTKVPVEIVESGEAGVSRTTIGKEFIDLMLVTTTEPNGPKLVRRMRFRVDLALEMAQAIGTAAATIAEKPGTRH